MEPTAALADLGLSAAEAQVYLALLRNGPMLASEIAEVTGLGRSNVYPAIKGLELEGLAETGTGYGSRFSARPADRGLPQMMARRRAALDEQERCASHLAHELKAITEPAAADGEPVIQVLRNPGVIAERWARLQAEAQREVAVCVKAPFYSAAGNTEEHELLRRGVRCRGLYEEAIVDDPEVAPFLEAWATAGEDIRVYPGELPIKLALFDCRIALIPLDQPGDRGSVTAVIRHVALGPFLQRAFDALWAEGKPLVVR